VWFQGGGIVAAETTGPLPTTDAVEVLCELLRNVEGHFEFEAGAGRDDLVEATAAEIEPLLVEAEQMVAEWSEIEAVVPSLDAWVTLVEELPKSKVTVDAPAWKVIIAVGGGSTVRDIGTWMGFGELAVCRGIRDVVKLGLAEISEAPLATEPADVSPFDRTDEVAADIATEADPMAGMGVHPDWDNTPPWAEETQWVEDAGYLSFEPQRRPDPVYQPFDEVALQPEPEFEPVCDVEAETELEPVAGTLEEALPEVPDDASDVAPEPVAEEAEVEPAPVDRRRLAKFLGSVGK
jgi:hypothetical protein